MEKIETLLLNRDDLLGHKQDKDFKEIEKSDFKPNICKEMLKAHLVIFIDDNKDVKTLKNRYDHRSEYSKNMNHIKHLEFLKIDFLKCKSGEDIVKFAERHFGVTFDDFKSSINDLIDCEGEDCDYDGFTKFICDNTRFEINHAKSVWNADFGCQVNGYCLSFNDLGLHFYVETDNEHIITNYWDLSNKYDLSAYWGSVYDGCNISLKEFLTKPK